MLPNPIPPLNILMHIIELIVVKARSILANLDASVIDVAYTK